MDAILDITPLGTPSWEELVRDLVDSVLWGGEATGLAPVCEKGLDGRDRWTWPRALSNLGVLPGNWYTRLHEHVRKHRPFTPGSNPDADGKRMWKLCQDIQDTLGTALFTMARDTWTNRVLRARTLWLRRDKTRTDQLARRRFRMF